MGPNETSPAALADVRHEGLRRMGNGSWGHEHREEEQDASTCVGLAHHRHHGAACHTRPIGQENHDHP